MQQSNLRRWEAFNMLRLRVVVLVAACAAVLVALQISAPLVGLSRDVGTWIAAAGMVILTGLILGPPLAKETGGRMALVIGAIVLGLGAVIYLYVNYVRMQGAIERANSNNKNQSTQSRSKAGQRYQISTLFQLFVPRLFNQFAITASVVWPVVG